MCCLRSRLQLWWQWRQGSGVFVCFGVRVDLDDVKRVCWQYWHMRHGRLQRGKCVRGRDGTACRLHMQPRLLFSLHNDDRVCGQHGYLCCLWSRSQMRGCGDTARFVCMRRRLLLARWRHYGMHRDYGVVHNVYCRKLLQHQRRAAARPGISLLQERCRRVLVRPYRARNAVPAAPAPAVPTSQSLARVLRGMRQP
jgi:hypothetical protein